MRINAVIIEDSVMPYSVNEFDSIPESVVHGEMILLHAPKEEFATDSAIKSLNGAGLSINHEWQTTETSSQIANISGTPTLINNQLVAEILVTDKEAIKRIQLPDNDPNKLVELSSSYDSDIDWTAGTTEQGEDFHGVQRKFMYNHVALLTEGQARGGSSIRILNKKPEVPAMEFTKVRLSNGTSVRVANEDVEKVENMDKEHVDNAADKIKNMEEKIKNMQEELEKEKENAKKTKVENSNLEGQLTATKEQLEQANSSENIEKAAIKLANEKSTAEKIMNGFKGNLDDLKGLQGLPLKQKVITSLRAANSLPVLTTEQLANEGYVDGLYQSYSDMAGTQKVAGAEVFRMNNQKQSEHHIKRVHAGDKS